MRRVIIESPFAGDVERNTDYARRCLRDSLSRGEAPLASHLLYPQVLKDENAEERRQGVGAGLSWATCAATIVYVDHGISRGMELGIAHAKRAGRKIEYRSLMVP
jgi:hypothetical protein